MASDLKGKTVLISGGAGGIGGEIARELLLNDVKGLSIVDINEKRGNELVEKLKEFGSNRILFIKTDVRNKTEFEDAFKKTIDKWNSLDVVINSMGIMNDDQWRLSIDINCTAVVQSNLLSLNFMGKNKGGKGGTIINIASVAGLQSCHYILPVYTATKHFVMGLSGSLSNSFYHNCTGVKILTLCPGSTDTSLLENCDKKTLNIVPNEGADVEKLIKSIPVQTASYVAKVIPTMITKGDNGSVWVVNHGQAPYQLRLPKWETGEKTYVE